MNFNPHTRGFSIRKVILHPRLLLQAMLCLWQHEGKIVPSAFITKQYRTIDRINGQRMFDSSCWLWSVSVYKSITFFVIFVCLFEEEEAILVTYAV